MSADQIYHFNSSIGGNEYNHVTFSVLREVDISITGMSDGNISFIALDDVNYQNWLSLTNFTAIYQTIASGEFTIRFVPSISINGTLNMLFYNPSIDPILIEYTIDEIITTTDDSPLSVYTILISSAFILLLHKKTIQYRQDN